MYLLVFKQLMREIQCWSLFAGPLNLLPLTFRFSIELFHVNFWNKISMHLGDMLQFYRFIFFILQIPSSLAVMYLMPSK